MRQAAIYVRISSDPNGQRLGVTRQLADCRTKATAMGWKIHGVYEDNDVSASGKKPRPAYRRMLADLESGRINAVVVWDLDRLTRRPIEVEEFIDLADRRGVALASVGGDVDLATDNGRLFARIKGAVARAEVERKSVRQKSANAQRAASGRPSGGRRPFGYEPGGMVVDDVEAAEVRKAASDLLAGGSLRGIVGNLNARGVRTTAGGPWHPTEMRRLLVNPRYAGLRAHRGEVVGPAAWPSILDEDTYRAVVAVLSDPRRHKAGPPRRYLLSGLARCSVCEGRVFGVTEKHKSAALYRCESRAHVSRRADDVDALVVKVMLQTLAAPDVAELLTDPSSGEEAQELRDEERGLRARLDGLAESFAAGEIDRGQLRAGTGRLRSRLEQVTADLAEMSRTPILTDLLTTTDVEATWSSMDLDRQRSVIDALVTVKLHPPGRGARTFDPRTVEFTWRTG
jgi:site-specific DNA recombinase